MRGRLGKDRSETTLAVAPKEAGCIRSMQAWSCLGWALTQQPAGVGFALRLQARCSDPWATLVSYAVAISSSPAWTECNVGRPPC